MISERLDKALFSFREEIFSIIKEEVLKVGGRKEVVVELPCDIDEDSFFICVLDSVYIEDDSLYAHGYNDRFGEVEEDICVFTCDELLTIIKCM